MRNYVRDKNIENNYNVSIYGLAIEWMPASSINLHQ